MKDKLIWALIVFIVGFFSFGFGACIEEIDMIEEIKQVHNLESCTTCHIAWNNK